MLRWRQSNREPFLLGGRFSCMAFRKLRSQTRNRVSTASDDRSRRRRRGLTAGSRAHLHTPLKRAVLQVGAQHLLVELADARLGDLRDERELVGQPPLGDASTQVLEQ